MISASRNEADNKRNHSNTLAEVAEENNQKLQNSLNGSNKPTNLESSTKIGIEQNLRSLINFNL
jgi:t-SNARE complex subunit (syntaxin)